jgi:large subunit ribosomal protein L9
MSVVEIVLLEDIQGLGKFGQKKQVKMGYARNFLFPKGLALLASPQNITRFESLRKKEESRRENIRKDAQAQADKINGKTFTFSLKTHDNGKLYGSVSATEIQAAIEKEAGVSLEKKDILLTESLKEVGEFSCSIHIYSDIVAKVSIIIESTADKK